MIKKIIHFSDLHLKIYKDHDLYRLILNKAFAEWREHNPDRIVFSGDLVHSKNQMSPELIDMIAWVLTECSKICRTIIIPGNHDFLEANMGRLDAITPVVESLGNSNIVYYKNRGVYEDDNVNWCVYSLMDHNIPPDFVFSDKKNIGIFHGAVHGLKTDVGHIFTEGYDTNKFSGCDIVLCGDIHKRQIFNIPNNKKAYMVGSFIQQDYGETVKSHGYGLYDLETEEYTFFDIKNPRPFFSFKITSIDDIINGNEKLINS